MKVFESLGLRCILEPFKDIWHRTVLERESSPWSTKRHIIQRALCAICLTLTWLYLLHYVKMLTRRTNIKWWTSFSIATFLSWRKIHFAADVDCEMGKRNKAKDQEVAFLISKFIQLGTVALQANLLSKFCT